MSKASEPAKPTTPADGAPDSYRTEYEGRQVVVHNEDCIAGMLERLEPGSIDVVVTSPPYNLGTDYVGYDDSQARPEYLGWMGEWGRAVSQVLSESGSIFLNIGGKPSDPWGPFEVLFGASPLFRASERNPLDKVHRHRQGTCGRQGGIDRDFSTGHYKPINSSRFLNDAHEYIFHLTPRRMCRSIGLAIGVGYQDKSNVKRWNSARADLRCRGNTWFVPNRTIQNRSKDRPHPAAFRSRFRKCASSCTA